MELADTLVLSPARGSDGSGPAGPPVISGYRITAASGDADGRFLAQLLLGQRLAQLSGLGDQQISDAYDA